MGKLIAFWSYKHGWGTTTILAGTAYILDELVQLKNILCVDSNYKFNNLHSLMGVKDGKTIDEAIIMPDNIKSYVVNVKNTDIDILAGSKIQTYDYLEGLLRKNQSIFNEFIDVLLKHYDLILWDLNAGSFNMTTSFLLKKADLIVNILRQEKHSIDCLLKNKPETAKVPVINCVNFYEEMLNFDINAFRYMFKKEKVYTIPYLPEILKAVNEDSFYKFISGQLLCKSKLECIAKEIIDHCGLEYKHQNEENKKPNFKTRMLKSFFAKGV